MTVSEPAPNQKPGRKLFEPGNKAAVGRRPQNTLLKKLRDLTAPEWPSIVETLISQAKSGDMRAVEIIASRCAPADKAVGPCIRLDIPPGVPHAERARRIVQAVTDGELPPDQAKTVMELITASVQLAEFQALEKRITELEARRV